MSQWLLRSDVAAELSARMRAGLAPTAEQRADFMRSVTAFTGSTPRNLRIAGDVAEIRVEGILTPRPDFLMMIFGIANTTYRSIQDSLAIAGSDPTIARASFYVDSPGGTVAGLFETLAAIEGFSKPITVRAAQACSAAYAIAAAAGPITATTPAAAFGSIGVAASLWIDPEHEVDIASTAAPNKRPDLTTEAGKAIVRAELDALHELFAGAVAKGRKTTVAIVNKSFGRGGVVLAGEAVRLGMIDSGPNFGSSALSETSSTSSAATSGKKVISKMDINTLKAQHPETYEAVMQAGRDDEFNRVTAHLTLGKASGDIRTSVASIEAREGFTAAVQAKHMAASMNRRDQQARQWDSDFAGSVIEGIQQPTGSGNTLLDQFAGDLDNGDRVARAMNLPAPQAHRV